MTELLPLEQITIEPTIHPRSTIFWHTSYNYYLAMRSGAKFPPITVTKYNDKVIVVDGVHRLKATQMFSRCEKIEKPTIEVQIIAVKNLDEAYVEAVKRNIKHGQPLSPYEKLEIHNRLTRIGWNKKSIAKLIQIPLPKLEKFLEQRVLTKGNKTITLKSPLKHLGVDADVTKEGQRYLAARSQLNLVNQLVLIIREGWLDAENKELQQALKDLYNLLTALNL